ncbi:MAG: HAD family hydrolase [Lachnospiraceae bacterium]
MIQAVIFDMDGTLIDTEKYYRICWPQALAHFGYTMSDEQALSMRSLGQPYAPEHLKEMFQDPDLDYPAIRVYRKQLMEEYLERDGIQIKPGAVELLEYLKEKKIQRAIATATDTERAARYLKQIGLYEYFDRILCANMVKCGKPSPDIYIYACQQLGSRLCMHGGRRFTERSDQCVPGRLSGCHGAGSDKTGRGTSEDADRVCRFAGSDENTV